jgi:hypothetical protein
VSFATTPSAPCNGRSGWIGANPEGESAVVEHDRARHEAGAPLCLILAGSSSAVQRWEHVQSVSRHRVLHASRAFVLSGGGGDGDGAGAVGAADDDRSGGLGGRGDAWAGGLGGRGAAGFWATAGGGGTATGDHVIVFNDRHLLRLVRDYIGYYHNDRTHLGLAKATPASRSPQTRPVADAVVIALSRLGGLHHRYEWRAAA